MRRKVLLLLLLYVIFLCIGCRTLSDSYTAYQACRNDTVCWSQAQQAGHAAAVASDTVVSGGSTWVGALIGSIVTGLSAVILGFKKQKKV